MSMAKYNKDMYQTVVFDNLIRQAERKELAAREVKRKVMLSEEVTQNLESEWKMFYDNIQD